MGTLLDSGMTLERYIKTGIPVEAQCETCDFLKRIDVAALAAKVGPQFKFWNRRSPDDLDDDAPF